MTEEKRSLKPRKKYPGIGDRHAPQDVPSISSRIYYPWISSVSTFTTSIHRRKGEKRMKLTSQRSPNRPQRKDVSSASSSPLSPLRSATTHLHSTPISQNIHSTFQKQKNSKQYIPFNRLLSPKNPTSPSPLLLTKLTTTPSFSLP